MKTCVWFLKCFISFVDMLYGPHVGVFCFVFQKIMTYLFDFPHGPKVLYVNY